MRFPCTSRLLTHFSNVAAVLYVLGVRRGVLLPQQLDESSQLFVAWPSREYYLQQVVYGV